MILYVTYFAVICIYVFWNGLFNLYHSLGIFSRRQFDIFLIFPSKQDLTFHGEDTVCMKCQILSYGKNKKNISKCRLLKILPRVLSVKVACSWFFSLYTTEKLLTIKVPSKICSKHSSFFSQKIIDISYGESTSTDHMKCQVLFTLKNTKKKKSECFLLLLWSGFKGAI